jgi:acetylglutamate kinase
VGFVGRIKEVRPAVVMDTLKEGRVPVVSPISANETGDSYNVNADSAAAALAAAARCTDLVFITDVAGVLADGEVRPSLAVREARSLIDCGTIKGGMVAKMESAFDALDRGVPRVHIIQWQGSETLRTIIDRKQGPGTIIHP